MKSKLFGKVSRLIVSCIISCSHQHFHSRPPLPNKKKITELYCDFSVREYQIRPCANMTGLLFLFIFFLIYPVTLCKENEIYKNIFFLSSLVQEFQPCNSELYLDHCVLVLILSHNMFVVSFAFFMLVLLGEELCPTQAALLSLTDWMITRERIWAWLSHMNAAKSCSWYFLLPPSIEYLNNFH